jgi:hypothetical protein
MARVVADFQRPPGSGTPSIRTKPLCDAPAPSPPWAPIRPAAAIAALKSGSASMWTRKSWAGWAWTKPVGGSDSLAAAPPADYPQGLHQRDPGKGCPPVLADSQRTRDFLHLHQAPGWNRALNLLLALIMRDDRGAEAPERPAGPGSSRIFSGPATREPAAPAGAPARCFRSRAPCPSSRRVTAAHLLAPVPLSPIPRPYLPAPGPQALSGEASAPHVAPRPFPARRQLRNSPPGPSPRGVSSATTPRPDGGRADASAHVGEWIRVSG